MAHPETSPEALIQGATPMLLGSLVTGITSTFRFAALKSFATFPVR